MASYFALEFPRTNLDFDPREGERLISSDTLSDAKDIYRVVTFSRRPNSATKRFDISYFFPHLKSIKATYSFSLRLFLSTYSACSALDNPANY